MNDSLHDSKVEKLEEIKKVIVQEKEENEQKGNAEVHLVRQANTACPAISATGTYYDIVQLLFDGLAQVELDAYFKEGTKAQAVIWHHIDLCYECLQEMRKSFIEHEEGGYDVR